MSITILGWKRNKLVKYIKLAEEISSELAKLGFYIKTGSGNGIMKAGNKGAFEIDKEKSIGITVKSLIEKEEPNYLYYKKENLLIKDTFSERKKLLMEETDINIFFPGGMGTLDEFTDLINLYKTESIKTKPVYLIGEKYWNSLIEWFGENNIVFPHHLINIITDDINLVVKEIKEKYYLKIIISKFSNINNKVSNKKINNRPKIGVSVILKYENDILLGRRKGSHGDNTWAFPGGHLELYEDAVECGKRELLEETGIDVSEYKSIELGYTNDIFKEEEKHYITLYVLYNVSKKLDAKLMEPNKCHEWKWFDINNIPEERFIPLSNYLKKFII
jgi:8-oxo-dGTP diphosphatase